MIFTIYYICWVIIKKIGYGFGVSCTANVVSELQKNAVFSK